MFKKGKKIILNCYTSEQYVYDLFKIDRASNFIPDWWKQLEKGYIHNNNIGQTATMKSCIGFTKHFKNGFIMPLWTDLALKLGNIEQGNYGWEFADMKTEMGSHPTAQRGNYLNEREYLHMKIVSPWILDCNEDIDWLFIKPDWNFNNPDEIIIPPATLDFKYQHTSHINFFLKFGTEPKEIMLESGSPIIHLIPITDKKVELNVEKISKEEMENYRSKNTKVSFLNKYNKVKRILKSQESKCPFGFKN